MNTFYVQLFTLLILLLCNFLAGLIPLFALKVVGRYAEGDHFPSQRNRVLSFFLHMGGGVFMSVCLLILMPESREEFDQIAHQVRTSIPLGDIEHKEEFPIPEFVILCGFFATFAAEEALHYILYHCRRRIKSNDPRVRFCSCAKRHTECSRTFKADNPDQTLFGLNKNRLSVDYSGMTNQTSGTNLIPSSILAQPVPNYGSVTNAADPITTEPVAVLQAPIMIANNGNIAIVQHLQDLSSPVTTSTSNILLVFALSLYGIFQGTTIGLLTSSSPWTTLLVTCLQQSILVFIVGWVGLAQSELMMPMIIYVIVLCVMSPFGISLAMLCSTLANVSPIVSGSSKAIVCGSLLYLTFCDLLRRRKLKDSPHIERFAGFTLGATVMAVMEYISIIL